MTPRLVLIVLAIALGAESAVLLERRRTLREEIAVAVAASAEAAAARDDAQLAAEVDRIRFALEHARNEPARTAEPHLALALGDGVLTLERGDIVFRRSTVRTEVSRGVRTVERVEAGLIALSDGVTLRPVGLADSAAVAPGEIRVPRADFDAIRPNLRPGHSAYFY